MDAALRTAISITERRHALYSGPIPVAARKIRALLPTALDLEEIIEIFAQAVGSRLAHTSFVYQHDGEGIAYSQGAPTQHSLTYRLTLGGNALGELSLARERPFTVQEVEWLEDRIGGFVHALYNALSHREALESSCGRFPQPFAIGPGAV